MPVLCAVWRHQHQHSTPNQAPTWPAMHSRATATPTATASFTHPPAVHERSRNSMKMRRVGPCSLSAACWKPPLRTKCFWL
jgi:hypothetical protein